MVYAMISKKIPNTEDGSRLDRCIRRLLGNINQAILEKLMRSSNILLDEKKTKKQCKHFFYKICIISTLPLVFNNDF